MKAGWRSDDYWTVDRRPQEPFLERVRVAGSGSLIGNLWARSEFDPNPAWGDTPLKIPGRQERFRTGQVAQGAMDGDVGGWHGVAADRLVETITQRHRAATRPSFQDGGAEGHNGSKIAHF